MATPSVPAGFKLVSDDNQAPEARGKAAAMSAYLARKGSPKQGKRLDRAMAKFETMWSQAPAALKEKYAGRSQKTDLAPSERPDLAPIPRPTNASLNAAKPGESPSQTQERQRLARGGKPVAAKPTPGNAFADLTKAPATPAGGAKPVTADTNGDGLQNNDDGMATNQLPVDKNNQPIIPKSREEQAAALLEDARKNPPTPEQRSGPDTYVPDKPAAAGQAAVTPAPAERPSQGLPNSGSGGMFPTSFPNTLGADQANRDRTVQEKDAQHQREAAAQQAKDRAETNASRATAGLPPINEGVPPPAAGAPPAAPAAGQPPYRPIGSRAEDIAAAGGDPTKLPTDSRMVVQGKVNGGSTPVNKAPAAPAARPTLDGNQPTGAPVMPTPMSKGGQPMDPAIKSDNGAGLTRVNRLTGLPFGFKPGDALPKSGDAAMQQRATDSGVRQVQAQAQAGIPAARPASPMAGPSAAMPRGPASQPERTGSSVPPIASPKQIADDPDILRKDNVAWANAQSGFSGGNPNDADHETAKNAQKKLYDGANEMDKIRLGNQSLKRSAGLMKDLDTEVQNAPRASNPANTRVTARRPATPEELKTGKVMPPVRRP